MNKNFKNIKIQYFFKNSQLLAKAFGIVPLMYGSLGLEYLTGENLNSDDIDILIPKVFITERWSEFKCILEENKYILIDEYEHTFEKDNIHYSYAEIEELESFVGISTSEIEVIDAENVSFKLLSLQQYLKVYTASLKDGYRVNVRKKKDYEKIEFIYEQIKIIK